MSVFFQGRAVCDSCRITGRVEEGCTGGFDELVEKLEAAGWEVGPETVFCPTCSKAAREAAAEVAERLRRAKSLYGHEWRSLPKGWKVEQGEYAWVEGLSEEERTRVLDFVESIRQPVIEAGCTEGQTPSFWADRLWRAQGENARLLKANQSLMERIKKVEGEWRERANRSIEFNRQGYEARMRRMEEELRNREVSWTDKQPTEPGWYWYRETSQNPTFMARVTGEMTVLGGQWAGPIEEPKE